MDYLTEAVKQHNAGRCECDLTDGGYGLCLAGQYLEGLITTKEILGLGVELTTEELELLESILDYESETGSYAIHPDDKSGRTQLSVLHSLAQKLIGRKTIY